ncbi:uncharacterized protein [Amphiura filiformis]|uniref:uncharacterized protein isoform X2 n=1 Tax=Amphiura filiformis TaxID=82378 RepID=UPI003B22277B
MKFGRLSAPSPLYAKPVRSIRLMLPRRMLIRRRLGRHWRYIILGCICACVLITFMVFFKALNLGKSSSSQYLNEQGEGGMAGFFFGKDGQHQRSNDPYERAFGGKSRLPPSIETMEEAPKSHTGDTLLNYYMTMYMDGIEISWASGVNTRDTLLEVMKDFLVMMLEADIDFITSSDKKTKTPIIINSETKPGDFSGDMTMVEWMSKISKYSNKGMKLNFKDDEALRVAFPLLYTMKETLHAPIWIHADVVAGPNNPKVTVHAKNLLDIIKEFPKVTLSLGWSTEWDPDGHQFSYTWREVINMAKVCAPIRQHVSFAVRAVFAVRSIRQLKWILSLTNRFTITVWANKYDILAIPELYHFRKNMDPKKVYYNLPLNMVEGLRKVSAEQEKDTGKQGRIAKWDRTIWQPMLLQSASLAFMGSEQVVIDGPGSWLVSRIPYQPELQRTRTTVVSGKIQFLRPIALVAVETRFQLFIRSSGVNPPPESKVQGVRLTITDDGTLSLSAENLIRAGAYGMQTSAKLPQTDCYTFRLVDKGDGFPVYCEIRTATCEGEDVNDSVSVELHLRVPYDTQGQLFYISLTISGGKDPVIIEDLTVI